MKTTIIAILAIAAFVVGDPLRPIFPENTAYGYMQKYGIPLAEKIRNAEKSASRIVGGVPAASGQYPYQAGLLSSIIGLNGNGVCGGSLISADRVITAAHCWFDGINQAWRVTVVLGSTTLFSGGTRINTSAVAVHPNWIPLLIRNDVAVIYLPNSVTFSNVISPIALPSGSELNEDFAGESVIASGFGLIADDVGLSTSQFLSHVRLNVITNRACSIAFPLVVQANNICTSGIGGVGTCRGDSGGPVVATRNDKPLLVGIVSFGSGLGCEINLPSAHARVTSFIDFINSNL